MSFIYGYTKNKTVIFWVLLMTFFFSIYAGTSIQITVIGVIVIVAGTALLMMIFYELIELFKEAATKDDRHP